VLVHAQPLLDVALRERARRHVRTAGSNAEALDRLRGKPEAERLAPLGTN